MPTIGLYDEPDEPLTYQDHLESARHQWLGSDEAIEVTQIPRRARSLPQLLRDAGLPHPTVYRLDSLGRTYRVDLDQLAKRT